MTTGVLTEPVPPAGVERRASPRGMTTWRPPVGGQVATSRGTAQGHSRRSGAGVPQAVARPPIEWRSGLTRPGFRPVAATTLRNLFMITIVMLLIFVLLPAVLSAQWASVG
jgi:hypothetical protein